MSRRALSWIDGTIILAVLGIAGALYLSETRPGTPTLVVWSCGGNYHSLNAFSREFEERHDCRVRYTAAPVQYLLEEVAFGDGRPDVLVGRAGPGWAALNKLGKLADGPDFFGADPYVIITPAGNPAGITGLQDLGKPGVRVASSPHAMRPKGKCPAHLMGMVSNKFFPGLAERWENNFIDQEQCGRDLPEPVMNGDADAAIVARSMLAYPGVNRERLEVVSIAPEHLDAMKVCRATIGQCLGVLEGAREPELAQLYRQEMLGEHGRRTFEEYAYIHITNPDVHDFDPFLKTFTPKRMPPWQIRLAGQLADSGIAREAIRRYLKVIHTFGPNELEAYCRLRVGELLAQQGQPERAAEQFRLLVRDYPRPEPNEWGSPVFALLGGGPELDLQPPAEYVERGRRALAQLPATGGEAPEKPAVVSATRIDAPPVIDGDPPKNGTRELALAEDLFALGEYDYATRDFLKVLHLCYPSRHRAKAGLRLGACAWLRGKPKVARAGWEWTAAEFAGSAEARRATRALEEIGAPEDTRPARPCPVQMPPWEPAYDTWGERGMTYGMALYDHDLPLFAFKEMVKLMHGVYKKHTLGAQARFRAGIAAWSAGHPRAAVLQWRICAKQHGGTPWGERSRAAIRSALNWPELSDQQRSVVEAAIDEPLPKVPKRNKPPCWQRFSLGREFLMVGIRDEGQAAMEFMKALTVTRATKGKYDEKVVPQAEQALRRAL